MNITKHRPIDEIAQEITKLWKNINFTALPYLNAMRSMEYSDNIHKAMYGHDSGKQIILYFLSNASTWRGADARRIKKELNKIVNRS